MTRHSLGTILFGGLVVRLFFLLFNLEIHTLPQGGADAMSFERKAWSHAQFGGSSLTQYLQSSSDFIVLLGSGIYSVIGRSPYVLGLFMVFLGLGVIYLTYRTALELWGDERVARMVAWATALFPQLTLHSVLFLREIPFAFCLTAASLCAVRYIKRNNVAYAVLFALWVAIGALFHSGIVFAIPGLIVGTLITRPREQRGKVNYYAVNIAAAALLIGVVYLANETGYGLGKFGGSLEDTYEQFEQRELRGTAGSAAFPEWMRVRGGMADLWKVPVRYIAFLFSPLIPLMVRSPAHLLGVIDAALYLFLFITLFRNWGSVRKNRPLVVLLVVLLSLCFVYALGVSNFGTAIRHRAKMAPILLIIAAGLPHLRRVRRRQAMMRSVAGKLSPVNSINTFVQDPLPRR